MHVKRSIFGEKKTVAFESFQYVVGTAIWKKYLITKFCHALIRVQQMATLLHLNVGLASVLVDCALIRVILLDLKTWNGQLVKPARHVPM